MIKKFEQLWNEDWKEEDPNKGPFDDQLIYGVDLNLHVGIRLNYYKFYGQIGTVVGMVVFWDTLQNYMGCFDDFITNNQIGKQQNIPMGHGFIIN